MRKSNVYIWNNVGHLTGSYHDGGGLVVVALNLEEATKMIRSHCPEDCEALRKLPSRVYQLADFVAEEIFIFPDAGCC